METAVLSDQDTTVRRNRQPSLEKHEAILEAAIRLFSENGYATTSVDAIAAEAGVAKQTVYHHFGNKNALLETVINRVTAQIIQPLDEIEIAQRPLAEVLTTFADRFMELTMTPQSHSFLRLLIGEATKSDHSTIQTLKTAMDQTQSSLTRFLSEQTARGRIATDDPRHAAQLFLGMLTGDLRIRGLLGILTEFNATTRKQHVQVSVATFLRAFAPSVSPDIPARR